MAGGITLRGPSVKPITLKAGCFYEERRLEMSTTELAYERRPFEGSFDSYLQTFIQLMDGIAAQYSCHWSFAGGFARDLYKGTPWNDFDVCTPNVDAAKRILHEMGVLEIGEQEGSRIPHDYYFDPYSFDKKKTPIHWIQADDEWAFAPQNFDFGINRICLKSDGYFYAPTSTWRDLDKGVIRKTADRMSTNLALRAIRFAAKYGFAIDSSLNKEIVERIASETSMGTDVLLQNVNKMIEDGVGDKAFKMMQRRHFPDIEGCTKVEQYVKVLNDMIVSGQGHREMTEGGGHYW